MTTPVLQMLERYDCTSAGEYRNALKEVIQEVALCGLSRGGFFTKAAFYGGSALRIFYGLDRFSEDLDFSLLETDKDFELSRYFPVLEAEFAANGFQLEIQKKEKSVESAVQSAFIKGGTLTHLLSVAPTNPKVLGISRSELVKIKFEVDTEPPPEARFQDRYGLLPTPHLVRMYDESSLFAGKIHAVLCRSWKDRVKGRDFYDYLWYLARGTSVNLLHIQKRLEQSGRWDGGSLLTVDILKQMLVSRFQEVDFSSAKRDVFPFIKNPAQLDLWSKDFFTSVTEDRLRHI